MNIKCGEKSRNDSTQKYPDEERPENCYHESIKINGSFEGR